MAAEPGSISSVLILIYFLSHPIGRFLALGHSNKRTANTKQIFREKKKILLGCYCFRTSRMILAVAEARLHTIPN